MSADVVSRVSCTSTKALIAFWEQDVIYFPLPPPLVEPPLVPFEPPFLAFTSTCSTGMLRSCVVVVIARMRFSDPRTHRFRCRLPASVWQEACPVEFLPGPAPRCP